MSKRRSAISTTSLAARHQWSKFPSSAQAFAILAWCSSEAKTLARSSTQAPLRKLGETIGNGSDELPSSQNILLIHNSPQGWARSVKKCKGFIGNLTP
jgi:hypothetical protein